MAFTLLGDYRRRNLAPPQRKQDARERSEAREANRDEMQFSPVRTKSECKSKHGHFFALLSGKLNISCACLIGLAFHAIGAV